MFQSLCVGGLTLAKMNISPCFPKPINLFIQGTTKKLLCRCNDTGIWMNRWTRVQIKCQKFSEPQNVCVCVGGREEWESECQKCTFTETESHCYHIGQHISICGIVIFYFNCNNKLCQALFMRAYVCICWMEVERGMILVVCLDDVHIMLYMLLRMCLFTLVNVANFLIFAVRCVLHWEIVMWCVILFFPSMVLHAICTTPKWIDIGIWWRIWNIRRRQHWFQICTGHNAQFLLHSVPFWGLRDMRFRKIYK